jgi:hypothetical protein
VPCALNIPLTVVEEKTASTVHEAVYYFSILETITCFLYGFVCSWSVLHNVCSWSVLNKRAKLDVSLNSLNVTRRSVHYKGFSSHAMWVQRPGLSLLCHHSPPPPPSGPCPPHSRGFYITQNDALQSVGLISKCDQPFAETST